MGIYLDLTLKRDPKYLAGELNAFEELTNALCLTFYLARFYSKTSTEARALSFTLAGKTLKHVLEVANMTDEEWMNNASKINDVIEQPSLTELYGRIREAASPQYRPILALLEGFERLSESLDKEPKCSPA
ncbi:MAG: hypothetical protein QW172_05075 [Candidatus Bathyarchaeia archaeon]